MGQDTTPTKPSQHQEELDKLNLEIKMAEVRKNNAEADTAEAQASSEILKSKWPGSKTEGLKGEITIGENVGYYAELLAYQSIDIIAERIANMPDAVLHNDTLIILGQEDNTAQVALWNLIYMKLEFVISQLKKTNNNYKPIRAASAKKLGVAGAISAGLSILGAVADIESFFKSNHSITNRKLTLNEKALKAAVAYQLSSSEKKLIILLPELNISNQGSLYKKFKELNSEIEDLKQIRVDISTKQETDFDKQADGSSRKTEILGQIDKEITAAMTLVSTLTNQTDTKLSPLESVATIDFIQMHKEAKILYLTICSQGGEVETSQAAIGHGRVSYLGGVVVSYFLSNIDGQYLYSRNEQHFETASFKTKNGIFKSADTK